MGDYLSDVIWIVEIKKRNSSKEPLSFSVPTYIAQDVLKIMLRESRKPARRISKHRYSKSERASFLKRFSESGMSIHDFCERYGASPSSLRLWSKQAKEHECIGDLTLENDDPGDLEAAIQKSLSGDAALTRGELCDEIGCEPDVLVGLLRQLVKEGHVIRTGRARGTKYQWAKATLTLAKSA